MRLRLALCAFALLLTCGQALAQEEDPWAGMRRDGAAVPAPAQPRPAAARPAAPRPAASAAPTSAAAQPQAAPQAAQPQAATQAQAAPSTAAPLPPAPPSLNTTTRPPAPAPARSASINPTAATPAAAPRPAAAAAPKPAPVAAPAPVVAPVAVPVAGVPLPKPRPNIPAVATASAAPAPAVALPPPRTVVPPPAPLYADLVADNAVPERDSPALPEPVMAAEPVVMMPPPQRTILSYGPGSVVPSIAAAVLPSAVAASLSYPPQRDVVPAAPQVVPPLPAAATPAKEPVASEPRTVVAALSPPGTAESAVAPIISAPPAVVAQPQTVAPVVSTPDLASLAPTAPSVSAPVVSAPAAPEPPPASVLAANPASVPPVLPTPAVPTPVSFAAASAASMDVPTGPLWPQEMVRSLRRMQDSLAVGNMDALTQQRGMIDRIEREFTAAEPSTWRDPRNARAAVIYFLSGGNPNVLRRMMGQQPPPAVDPRLLRGTLAYLEGREDEALKQLSDIDARSLPPSLGGQVALAQAALWVRKDGQRSAKLLEVARLLAPGTLVEEAALRRAILVASQSGDSAAFERLARQYLFRFRGSVYADNFRQRFASALSRMSFVNDPAQFHRLDELLKLLDADSRRDMELMVARAAVVQGKTSAANMAAQRALSSVPDASADAERARLYRGAALAPSATTYSAALNDLKAVDRTRLAPADAALLDAASATAAAVQRAGEEPRPLPVASKAPGAAAALPKEEEPAVMERARAAIATVDSILKGGAR